MPHFFDPAAWLAPTAWLDPLVWTDRLAALGAWSLEGFWLPVALWTLAAALALFGDARLRVRRPLVRRDLLTALLAALPLTLVLRALLNVRGAAPLAVEMPFAVDVVAVAAPAAGSAVAAPLPVGMLVAGALVVLAGLVAAVGLARLAGGAAQLARWRRVLPGAPAEAVQARADALAGSLGLLPVPVRIGGAVPLTFGVRRPVIVVPADLVADAAALDLALLHELAHVHHGDARGHLLACAVTATFGWHPLVRIAARRLELAREQACDAAVVERAPHARRAYADLLVRFASQGPDRLALSTARMPLAPSMAVRSSHLKPRLTAMTRPIHLTRPAGLAAGLAVLLALGGSLPAFAQTLPPSPMQPTFSRTEGVPVPKTQVSPEYPAAAKEANVGARVILEVMVGADGAVTDARVLRTSVVDRQNETMPAGNAYEAPFGEAALASARAWTFEPAVRDGAPVASTMTLPMRFTARHSIRRPILDACGITEDLLQTSDNTVIIGRRGEGRAPAAADRTALECVAGRLEAGDAELRDAIRSTLTKLGN